MAAVKDKKKSVTPETSEKAAAPETAAKTATVKDLSSTISKAAGPVAGIEAAKTAGKKIIGDLLEDR